MRSIHLSSKLPWRLEPSYSPKLLCIAWIGLLFFVSHHLWAQVATQQYGYTIGADVYKGFILRHSPDGKHLAVSHPVGVSVFVNKQTFGEKYHERAFGYPDAGIALDYLDYRNVVLGKSIMLSSYLQIPVWQFRQGAINFKIGGGLAYHTNPHDRTHNNSNIALGTPVTFSILGALQFSRQISSKWAGQIALNLTHFSNGAYTQPNLGINIPTVRFGLLRKVQPITSAQTASADPYDEPFAKTYHTVIANYGTRAMEYAGERLTFVDLGLQTSYRFSPVSAINVGADVFFQHLPWKDNPVSDDPDEKAMNIGMVAGHELFYDRLSLVTQLGVYLYRSFDEDGPPIYQRYGLRFAWTAQLFTSLCLKAHLGQAEFIEWGIGLKL